jgi:hypothetical protein
MPVLELAISQDDPLQHFVKTRNTGPSLRRKLIDPLTGLALDLTDAVCLFVAVHPDGSAAFDGWATIEAPASDGIVRYDFSALDTATACVYFAEFQVTFPEGQTLSYPFANSNSARNYIRLQITEGL